VRVWLFGAELCEKCMLGWDDSYGKQGVDVTMNGEHEHEQKQLEEQPREQEQKQKLHQERINQLSRLKSQTLADPHKAHRSSSSGRKIKNRSHALTIPPKHAPTAVYAITHTSPPRSFSTDAA
jgi:hypothetical protein